MKDNEITLFSVQNKATQTVKLTRDIGIQTNKQELPDYINDTKFNSVLIVTLESGRKFRGINDPQRTN